VIQVIFAAWDQCATARSG